MRFRDHFVALIEAGIPLDSPCGGQGTCLKCKVQLSGISQKFSELEREKISPEELSGGWHLACQVTVEESGEVCLPEMEVSRAKAGFGLLGEEIPLQPNVRRRHFELSRPTISDQRADWDRLVGYLETLEPHPVRAGLPLLQEISGRLREQSFTGEVVLVGDEVIALAREDVPLRETYLYLGWTDYRQGQYDSAVRAFQTAYALDPAQQDAFAGLGMTLAKMGRCPEAISHLEFALSRQPVWAEVQQALETCRKQ